MGSRWTCLSM